MKYIFFLLILALFGCGDTDKGKKLNDVYTPMVLNVPSKTFGIQYSIDFNSGTEVEKINLYISHDKGSTWSLHNSYPPSSNILAVQVSAEGQYSFYTQAVGKQLSESPPKNGTLPKVLANVKLP